MSMINELVDRLRAESKSMGKYGVDYMATLLTRAADTIVMLSEKVRADRPQGEWIPCSERLPEDIRPVLVTWKNNDPASYYQYIVGKHFIGTAHYHRGKWYWYSSVTEDLLAEYGKCDSEEFDEAIECIAWMPLPKPYEADATQTDCPWK